MKTLAQGEAQLHKLAESDFETLAALAQTIWRSHYASIVSTAQIEYMLAGRYTAENLQRYVDASDRWLHLLKLHGTAVGYCSYALTEAPRQMKLEQLYLLPTLHGRGLGGQMLRHIEAHSLVLGCDTLFLQVNKRNVNSIAMYRKSGFTVREEAVFDIGNGYKMDDLVMEKALGQPRDQATSAGTL